ncbi:LytR C-terminal domain-containing protein [Actinoplanes sp. M2I2]|uniref:LytR C-terminal domain-containing protein n=1 Tax=Actinoplanes sp. M2I2 TaxID=1734444 RepID=UPI002021199A|nr:LytR C-terminal domain-containing protein [Actinoplanes sp. M2I2]
MPLPLSDRLRQLEADVQDLRVLPAAAVRARGRRRKVTTTVGAVAAVATAAGVTATLAWPQPDPASRPGPAANSPTVACVLTLPNGPGEVRLRLFDGGAPGGLTDATAAQLRARSFTVLTLAAGPTEPPITGPATVRFGPAAVGAASLIRAHLHGDADLVFEPGRPDATVDVTLGASFGRLATTTEVNQALVAAGRPSPPPECSATPGR